jgi:hypothetical protein
MSHDLLDALPRLGWSASRAELIGLVGRREFDRACQDGLIVRVAQGRYSLPESIGPAQAAAIRVNGVVSHLSAALRHGLSVGHAPPLPTVTVPRGRNLTPARRAGVAVHVHDLAPDDVEDGVTTALRTVLDCAARLSFAEALVIADSALRNQLVDPAELLARAATMPAPVGARVLTVAQHADGRPHSAFESLVRGHAIEIPGLRLVPQVLDSFEFHAGREALLSDCQRYNDFLLADIALVRFAWEHSMHRPGYVRSTLAAAVALRERQLGLAA